MQFGRYTCEYHRDRKLKNDGRYDNGSPCRRFFFVKIGAHLTRCRRSVAVIVACYSLFSKSMGLLVGFALCVLFLNEPGAELRS